MINPLHVAGPVDERASHRQGAFGVVRREHVGPVVRRPGVQVNAVKVDVRRESVNDNPVPVVQPGLAAADQADAGVEPFERLGPPPRVGHVLLRGALADLPVAVHLVAETPVPDAVRLGVPVGAPPTGPTGVARSVAVLHPGQRLVQGARAHVEAEHRLDSGGRAPGHELVGASLMAA